MPNIKLLQKPFSPQVLYLFIIVMALENSVI